mgnify:CR=1 FL=1
MKIKFTNHPLQSKIWAEFREAWGNEVLKTKYGYITIHHIPFTKYKLGMFIKGPKPSAQMIKELKNLGTKENLVFVKLEPNVQKDDRLIKLLKNAGAVSGKTLFTPTTFWIDLTKSEEELLKSFTPKTRYNIRLAQKHGVVVKEDNSDKAFEIYLELVRETVQRQGFYAHTEKYHKLMWEYLRTKEIKNKRTPIAHLLTATYQGDVIATWILFAYGGFLYYPYGASSGLHKDIMANNLIMWEAIRFGKKLGLKTFDLWGREPGKGFTRFKEGYNPKVIEFLGTWDLPTSSFYWPYRILETLRWKLLRIKSKLIKPKF